MTMTPGITQALSHLRAAGYCAEADAMESALASAEPVAWYAPSIDDTCTAAKKAQRERDLPELARLFAVPLHTHPSPAHAGAGAEALAKEVWTALDKESCPGVYMQIAYETIFRRLAGGDHA